MNNSGPADAGIRWTKKSGLPLPAWGTELPVQGAGAPGNRRVGEVFNCFLLALIRPRAGSQASQSHEGHTQSGAGVRWIWTGYGGYNKGNTKD